MLSPRCGNAAGITLATQRPRGHEEHDGQWFLVRGPRPHSCSAHGLSISSQSWISRRNDRLAITSIPLALASTRRSALEVCVRIEWLCRAEGKGDWRTRPTPHSCSFCDALFNLRLVLMPLPVFTTPVKVGWRLAYPLASPLWFLLVQLDCQSATPLAPGRL